MNSKTDTEGDVECEKLNVMYNSHSDSRNISRLLLDEKNVRFIVAAD